MSCTKSLIGLFGGALFTAPLVVAQSRSAETPQAGAATAQEVPSGEARVSLDELLREALSKNTAIRSAARKVASLRARVPRARTLPYPVASAGWMGSIKPFVVQQGDPSSFRSLGAMQDIPYPGKLKLRGQIAGREAEAAWWATGAFGAASWPKSRPASMLLSHSRARTDARHELR